MKIKTIDEDKIELDNGTEITYVHNTDCCESVYADFSQIEKLALTDHDFSEKVEIERVDGYGIRIEGFFIPCYNVQNGFYSSNLKIKVKYPDGHVEKIDITGCTKYVHR